MTRALGVVALALFLVLPFYAVGQNWQQGFDFRNTPGYVTDPPTSTYVLSTTAYPTVRNGVTFGWANPPLVSARDRSLMVDPRLAGINYVSNGAPAKFYVDLPSAGTYNLSLAMGDDGYGQCWTQCQVQFLDGSTVVGTVSGGFEAGAYFYDAAGRSLSAASWPGSNMQLAVSMTGSRLTVQVGTNSNSGDFTPIAYLGVAQISSIPSFNVSASPSSVSILQGNAGTTTVTTSIDSGFSSAISLCRRRGFPTHDRNLQPHNHTSAGSG